MKSIRPMKFYTETDEPLSTKKGIRFYFEYMNNGDEAVNKVPAEIFMGSSIRTVNLPGLSPNERKTVEMVLTNNISDEVNVVGVRLGSEPENKIVKRFSWIGKIDLQIDELKRYEVMDTADDRFYRAFIHNKGTKRAKDIQVSIEKDNKFYGKIVMDELAPKSAMPINVGFSKKHKGLFKLTLNAKAMLKGNQSTSRSFHVEMTPEQEV